MEDVHFHEVGAVDSIADIVCAAAALDFLAPARVLASPLPVGTGLVRGAIGHGPLPSPPPATLEILCRRGAPTFDAACGHELVTPTGACLVAAAAAGFCAWPSMTPERAGYGAGSRDLADRPNVCRLVLGSPLPDLRGTTHNHEHHGHHEHHEHGHGHHHHD